MADYFEIEGQNFISSKRASELTGYAKDYVGQLCRMGKIESKLIGRNWFVSESSLLNHKNGSADAAASTVIVKPAVTIIGPTTVLSIEPEVSTSTRSVMPQAYIRSYAMSMPKPVRVADPRYLSGIDVRYYDSSPIFYTDVAPLFPSPARAVRAISPDENRVNAPARSLKMPRSKEISVDEISSAFSGIAPVAMRSDSRKVRSSIQAEEIQAANDKTGSFKILKIGAAFTILVIAVGIGTMTIFTERVLKAEILASTGNISVEDSYLMRILQ